VLHSVASGVLCGTMVVISKSGYVPPIPQEACDGRGAKLYTLVDVQVIHTPITPNQLLGYKVNFFSLSYFIAMHILQDALHPTCAFTWYFPALTMLLEFIRPYHQGPNLFHHGPLRHNSFILYRSPNAPSTLPSLLPFLHLLLPPIHSHSQTICAFQHPKRTVPHHVPSSI